jgi:hypothetical protein
MFIKLVVVALLLVIMGSLASAMFYLLRDGADSNRMVKALTLRIGLSIAAFLILMLGFLAGLIEPTAGPFGPGS